MPAPPRPPAHLRLHTNRPAAQQPAQGCVPMFLLLLLPPQFVTSTPVVSLSSGPYCKSLRHLCVDWDVAFESAAMLEHCAVMEVCVCGGGGAWREGRRGGSSSVGGGREQREGGGGGGRHGGREALRERLRGGREGGAERWRHGEGEGLGGRREGAEYCVQGGPTREQKSCDSCPGLACRRLEAARSADGHAAL